MTVIRNELYDQNLSALKAFQPDIGARIEATAIPEAIVPSKGRDGSDTFRLPGADGRDEWFGRSSMPTISTVEIFAGLRRDGGNVWLPGILTGMEPLEVARRIPNHCAIFVLETSPLPIKLALHLHDYSALLSGGRLVFILTERLRDDLRQFFQTYPGYEQPTHMLTVPQVSASQLGDLQRRVEQAVPEALQVQSQILETSVQAIHAQARQPAAGAPRVAVLSVDPTPAVVEHARRVARALTTLHWPHEVCIPDSPGKCHIAARFRAVERLRADWILILGSGAGRIRPLLPQDLPMATWYAPGCAVASDSAVELGPWDLVFAPSPGARKAMVTSGTPADRIEICEAAADDTIFCPIHHGTDEPEPQATACATPPGSDVAVLMDLPDDRAEACGITLVSHVALWRALQDAASHKADAYEASKAGEWLDEAQTQSGVTLQDETLRQRFLTLIRTCIAPVAIGQAAVRSVRRSGCRVAVWGMNWPACADERITVCGRIPTDAQLNEVFNTSRIVVLPEASDPSIQTALNALAAGARVIYRASSQAFATDHPGLASLQRFLHPYRTGSELTAKVQSLLSESQRHSNETEEARRMILAGHTIAHRLQTIYERVLEKQKANTQEPLCGRS